MDELFYDGDGEIPRLPPAVSFDGVPFSEVLDALRTGSHPSSPGEPMVNIDLGFSNVDNVRAKELADVLSTNTTVTALSLEGNEIRCEGATALADMAEMNRTLTSLDIKDNFVANEGAAKLGEALASHDCPLKVLDLTYNEIQSDGAVGLASALKSKFLTTLKLSGNDISDVGAQELAAAVGNGSVVQALCIDNNNIGKEGATALAEALKKSTNLRFLDLKDNTLRDDGARVLGESLEANSSLKVLCFSNNRIGDAGVQALADSLRVNTTLTSLKLDNNSIGDEGGKAIGESLKSNHSLAVLNLSKNRITDDGLCVLAIGIAMSKGDLQKVDLTENTVGERGTRAIQGARKVKKDLILRCAVEDEIESHNPFDDYSGNTDNFNQWGGDEKEEEDMGPTAGELASTESDGVDELVTMDFSAAIPCEQADAVDTVNTALRLTIDPPPEEPKDPLKPAPPAPPIPSSPPDVSPLVPALDRFVEFIKGRPSERSEIMNQQKATIKRFGMARSRLVELFSLLYRYTSSEAKKKMNELGVPRLCLDLFFEYPLNNFVHASVQAIILESFEDQDLFPLLFEPSECDLVNRLVGGFDKAKETGWKGGNLGYIINLINKINEKAIDNATVARYLVDNSEWDRVVEEVGLINDENSKEIGGPPPARTQFEPQPNAGLANLIAALSSLNLTPAFSSFG